MLKIIKFSPLNSPKTHSKESKLFSQNTQITLHPNQLLINSHFMLISFYSIFFQAFTAAANICRSLFLILKIIIIIFIFQRIQETQWMNKIIKYQISWAFFCCFSFGWKRPSHVYFVALLIFFVIFVAPMHLMNNSEVDSFFYFGR